LDKHPLYPPQCLRSLLTNPACSFTVEEIRELMDKVANIRNMSVIAHGKLLPPVGKCESGFADQFPQWITESRR
jgi:hypothetical protein